MDGEDEDENIFSLIEDNSLDKIESSVFRLAPTFPVEEIEDQVPPLSYAIVKQKDPDVIKSVLNISVNEPSTQQGNLPLHFASMYPDNKETIKFLIKSGANVTKRNNQGETALDIAASRGLDENVKALLKYCRKDECFEIEDLEKALNNSNGFDEVREILEKEIEKIQRGGTRKNKSRRKRRKSKKNGKRVNSFSRKIRRN